MWLLFAGLYDEKRNCWQPLVQVCICQQSTPANVFRRSFYVGTAAHWQTIRMSKMRASGSIFLALREEICHEYSAIFDGVRKSRSEPIRFLNYVRMRRWCCQTLRIIMTIKDSTAALFHLDASIFRAPGSTSTSEMRNGLFVQWVRSSQVKR